MYAISERFNKQFSGPIYHALGKITRNEARELKRQFAKTLYGSKYLLEFETEEAYNNSLAELKEHGHRIL